MYKWNLKSNATLSSLAGLKIMAIPSIAALLLGPVILCFKLTK